jgi:hypothetical protein
MTKGSVAFRKSDVSDAHIKQVVQKVAAETGVSEQDLMKQISDEIDKIEEIGQYSNILYDTLLQNAAENGAFKIIETSKFPVKKEEYDMSTQKNRKIFRDLIDLVELDNSSFFPLQSPDTLGIINKITPIFVPSSKKEYEHYNTIPTAAISNKGDFIFNTNFLESLLYYGAAIDVKPKGAKYVCNGGNIPDNWCYIEFIIMHEVLHWEYGDFFSGRRFKQYSQTAHNIGSDYRSNYLLVKNGYEQLPMGLFSDDINFDRPETNSYQKLMAVVDRELKKLPKPLQAWIEEQGSDVHPPPPPPKPPKPPKPWKPNVGELVINHKTGQFLVVTKDNGDGTYESEIVTKEEAEEILGQPIKTG